MLLVFAPTTAADPIVLPQQPGARADSLELVRPPQKIPEVDQAIERFRNQKYDEALQLLQAANKKVPDLPPARLLMAELFFSSNQPAVGRAVLEQAAAENPQYPGVYVVSGNQARAEGRRMDALTLYEKAEVLAEGKQLTERQRRSSLVQSRSGRAAVAEDRKDWPAAVAALTTLLELAPKDGLARERLARARFFLDKREEAYAELQQAARDDPNLKLPEVNMGLLFMEKGDVNQAVKWMQAAIDKSPKDARAHLELGHCLLQQGKVKEAKASADAAEKLDPKSRTLKVLRGLIALATKDYEEAERQYQALLQESPEDSGARDKLALALVEQPAEEKKRRAMELATMNVRLFPKSSAALSTLGWTYYRLGRTEEAERALRAALSGPGAKPETAYFLARMLADRGSKEEAKKLLELALAAPSADFSFRQDAQQQLQQLSTKSP